MRNLISMVFARIFRKKGSAVNNVRSINHDSNSKIPLASCHPLFRDAWEDYYEVEPCPSQHNISEFYVGDCHHAFLAPWTRKDAIEVEPGVFQVKDFAGRTLAAWQEIRSVSSVITNPAK